MKNMCARKSRSGSALVWVLMALWPSARPAVGQSRAIADNSFLIEEAYNQEPGVVQHIGASMIWLLRPSFNVMVEMAWTDQTAGPQSFVVNPGVRWAHNFAGGLQIVPGVAFPVGVGPSRGDRAAFLYLSFEHRFQNVQQTLNPNTGPP